MDAFEGLLVLAGAQKTHQGLELQPLTVLEGGPRGGQSPSPAEDEHPNGGVGRAHAPLRQVWMAHDIHPFEGLQVARSLGNQPLLRVELGFDLVRRRGAVEHGQIVVFE